MTESMVEKVARALEPFFSSADIAYKEHVQAARTAIEAMSTPSDAMITAFINATVNQWGTTEGLEKGLTAALQAALTEGSSRPA